MIKAIQTKYKGYKFRSRLESRWAVFFDALDIKWQYEPDGYELDGGVRYLPDFFLPLAPNKWCALDKYPGAGYWIEVKGGKPTAAEVDKMKELCLVSRHHGYMVYGVPGEFAPIRCNMEKDVVFSTEQKNAYSFITANLPELTAADSLYFSAFIDGCTPYDEPPDVASAINAAKSARFEFGESGATV